MYTTPALPTGRSPSPASGWTIKRKMKRTIFLLLIGSFLGLSIFSCEKENQTVTGKIISDSGCKTSKSYNNTVNTPDSLSCINYVYEKSGAKLFMKHVNAGFNCCPEKLFCVVNMSGDTIIIKEYEKSSMCDCNCLYDLELEITGVSATQYKVKFIEPYSGNQEKIIFEMDLANHPESSFCVIRKQYPWGMGF
jgi:hypothetical protein